jgi:hypothetical protein
MNPANLLPRGSRQSGARSSPLSAAAYSVPASGLTRLPCVGGQFGVERLRRSAVFYSARERRQSAFAICCNAFFRAVGIGGVAGLRHSGNSELQIRSLLKSHASHKPASEPRDDRAYRLKRIQVVLGPFVRLFHAHTKAWSSRNEVPKFSVPGA